MGNGAKFIAFCNGKWPHFFAGLLLLLFATSHFMMLRVKLPSQDSISTIFPFLTNWTLYLLAGILELVTAFVCLRNRGRELASLAIFIFLLVILWYRWALSYTGGDIKNCNCLGVLGKALHLSQTQEKDAPIAVLVLLALTIIPWLICKIFNFARSQLGKAGVAGRVAGIGLLLLCPCAYGQKTIVLTGQYDVYHYTGRGKQLFTNYTRHVAFTFTLSGQARSIFATNIDTNPEGLGLRTPWEGWIFDGTNSYTLMPELDTNNGYAVYATISPGQCFLRDYDESLDFYTIWLAYGLSSTNLPATKSGVVEIPLPWYNTRGSPFSHGFEWKITPSPDARFMSECQVSRNTNLDLSDDAEMSRPDVVGPLTLSGRNNWKELLRVRQLSYPQGTVLAVYKCKQWCPTNQVTLPINSEEIFADNIQATNKPTVQAQVRGINVTVREDLEQLLPLLTAKTRVRDYRFRTENRSMDAISPRIEYQLAPGDSWNKPDILRDAQNQRMFFPAKFKFVDAKHRSHFTWLLLVVILAPLVIIVFKSKHKIKQR